jgi:hypothetical protein
MSSRLTLVTTLQRQSELETLLSQAFMCLLEKPSYVLLYSDWRNIIETTIHHQKRAASYAADARYEMGMEE